MFCPTSVRKGLHKAGFRPADVVFSVFSVERPCIKRPCFSSAGVGTPHDAGASRLSGLYMGPAPYAPPVTPVVVGPDFMLDMAVFPYVEVKSPGDRGRYLDGKRNEMEKREGCDGLRGTFEDRYIKSTHYTLVLREDGQPGYFTVAYLFWGQDAYLEWVHVVCADHGTTGAYAARPLLEGMYAQEDEILHGWVFHTLRDLVGGLSMARLFHTPNIWLSWQGHAFTTRPVQLSGQLFLGADLKGSAAPDLTVSTGRVEVLVAVAGRDGVTDAPATVKSAGESIRPRASPAGLATARPQQMIEI
eukprot:jgi/Mesvir1/14995/Mv14654-RA.1